MVGYFTNPVPIRADLQGNPPFATLLAQIRRSTLDAMDHQQMPFPLLVQRLQPRRDSSRSPHFPDGFCAAQTPACLPQRSRLRHPIRAFELPEEEGQFDLSLHITEGERTLSAAFKYNTALFTGATAAAIGSSFLELLYGIVADPEQPVGTLPVLAADARRTILQSGVGQDVAYPETTVPELFEEQARLHPDGLAAEMFGTGERLTYDELNRRANRLAHRLRALGVGPEKLAGVLFERSLDLVAAIAGGAEGRWRLRSDGPRLPRAAAGFHHCATRGIPVVLTTRAFAGRVPRHHAILLDEEWPEAPERKSRLAGRARESCVRDLYLGLDRDSQRRAHARTPA